MIDVFASTVYYDCIIIVEFWLTWILYKCTSTLFEQIEIISIDIEMNRWKGKKMDQNI